MDRKFGMRFLNCLSRNPKSKTRTAFDKFRPRACRGERSRSIQNRCAIPPNVLPRAHKVIK
jgi:hypothetical protein